MKIKLLIIVGVAIVSIVVSLGILSQIDIYDYDKYRTVFGPDSPLMELGTGNPVLTKDNCERYADWLTKHQKKYVNVHDENSRYPPWGNQIFPLVDYCMDTGNLIKTTIDGQIEWEFQLENDVSEIKFVEPIPNTNYVKVTRSPAATICMDLALECGLENFSTSYVGIKKGDEIIISLYLEGRGQNYTIHLDAASVENMDGNYIRNIEVVTENKPVDYSVDENNKIDLFSIPLPINEKYHQVDYGELGYLIVEHDLKSKLAKEKIEYSNGKYIFRDGWSLDSYPPHTGYCAFIESDDGEDYWYEGGFSRDTLTSSKLHDDNPHQCKHNAFSCTCNIVQEQALENVGVLSYFDGIEEEFVGKALQEYLAETKVSNVSNQFVVGKYNFDYDEDVISVCGKFVESSIRNTFEVSIKDSKVTSFSMRPPMELCAINNDAIIYEFRYLGNEN